MVPGNSTHQAISTLTVWMKDQRVDIPACEAPLKASFLNRAHVETCKVMGNWCASGMRRYHIYI
jgi:hypothetical protein